MSFESKKGSKNRLFKPVSLKEIESDKMDSLPITDAKSKNTETECEKGNREELKRFLVSAYEQNSEIRQYLLDLEKIFISILEDMSAATNYTHPTVDPFHRMLVHKVADYYQLGHITDSTTNQIFVYPLSHSAFQPPLSKLYAELRPSKPENPRTVRKILVNPNRKICMSETTQSNPATKRSFEERKDSYIKARSRILGVPIAECEAQFKDFKISDKKGSVVVQDTSENVKASFLNKIHNVASTDEDISASLPPSSFSSSH